MTYNFDPDRWYDDRRALLEARLGRGEIDWEEFRLQLEELDRRHERMLERLDGTYRLPSR